MAATLEEPDMALGTAVPTRQCKRGAAGRGPAGRGRGSQLRLSFRCCARRAGAPPSPGGRWLPRGREPRRRGGAAGGRGSGDGGGAARRRAGAFRVWRGWFGRAEESQTTQNHHGNSELPGSLEESNDCFGNLKSPFLWKDGDDDTTINRQQAKQVGDKEYTPLPDLIDFPSLPSQRGSSRLIDSSLLKIEREKIIEQMKQVKEERKYLENIREELIKKVEKLFEQNKSKRYHACDSWKKKYFDSKKVTASLEEVLTKLREDLELYYKKLLMQLEAREIKMRPRNLANISDSKNYLIIQITEVQHAIDQLKRKLDTDKMKLILEVKMRKQAVSDLQTLKAELTQKKMSSSFKSPLWSIGCCNTF
ncbi:spermatogenesis-associated protein 1 isoform X2 [Onychomys torridus]|uniref:spermatogenesis-associated protein 1 isoform X2 n=1 Tax=Onychomys torridus TaxID=38674 RepID=UPI00167F2A0C|nr:spermatogenesis-associated protein 1 isoform X2 [Onychomys torridus]